MITRTIQKDEIKCSAEDQANDLGAKMVLEKQKTAAEKRPKMVNGAGERI